MVKRVVGILGSMALLIGIVACRDSRVSQIGDAAITETRPPTVTINSTSVATKDVVSVDDIKPGVTLQPTKDPLVTYTLTPIPTQVPSFSNVRLTHDLIWLERGGDKDGHLMRWDATKNEIEVLAGESADSLVALPGKVTDFDLKAKILLVSLQMYVSGMKHFELGSIDLVTNEYSSLLNIETHRVEIGDILLSPNGRWAAYILNELDPKPANENSPYLKQELFITRNAAGAIPVLFGSCEPNFYARCIRSLRWSPDNAMLAWRGPGGMWLGKLEEGSQLVFPDHYGKDEAWNLRYFPNSWSLNSKYLEVTAAGWEGGFKGVFELVTGRFHRIPETVYYYGTPYTETTWLPNNRVLVVESGYQVPDRVVPVKVYIYAIDTDSEDWLYLASTYEIDSEMGDEVFQHLQDNAQAFEFLRTRLFEGGVVRDSLLLQLISYNPEEDETIELNQTTVIFPPFPEEFYGAYGQLLGIQNNQSFLFEYEDHVIYMSSDGQYAADIRDLVGEFACCFAWVDN